MDELKSKYDLDDRTQVEKFLDEIEAFKLRMISSKEEFIRRIRYYAVHGKPCWVQGSSKQINMLTESDLDNSFKFALEDFSDKIEMLEKMRLGWMAQFAPVYAKKVCTKTVSPHRIMEMTVGAGCGPNTIIRELQDDMYYIGVDIDFCCAKNADAIGKYYGKNALGLCASLWDMPFEDDMFDVICSHFGIDECREVPTVMKEAARVLKPGGKLVNLSRNSSWLRYRELFEKYGVDEAEAMDLIRETRLYTDLDQLDSLADESGLIKTDYISFEKWYLVEYTKK